MSTERDTLRGITDDIAQLAWKLKRSISVGNRIMIDESLNKRHPYLFKKLELYAVSVPLDALLYSLALMLSADELARKEALSYAGFLTCGISRVSFTLADVYCMCVDAKGRIRENGLGIDVQGKDGVFRYLERPCNSSFQSFAESVDRCLNINQPRIVDYEPMEIVASPEYHMAIISVLPHAYVLRQSDRLFVRIPSQYRSFLCHEMRPAYVLYDYIPIIGSGHLSCLISFIETRNRCTCLSYTTSKICLGESNPFLCPEVRRSRRSRRHSFHGIVTDLPRVLPFTSGIRPLVDEDLLRKCSVGVRPVFVFAPPDLGRVPPHSSSMLHQIDIDSLEFVDLSLSVYRADFWSLQRFLRKDTSFMFNLSCSLLRRSLRSLSWKVAGDGVLLLFVCSACSILYKPCHNASQLHSCLRSVYQYIPKKRLLPNLAIRKYDRGSIHLPFKTLFSDIRCFQRLVRLTPSFHPIVKRMFKKSRTLGRNIRLVWSDALCSHGQTCECFLTLEVDSLNRSFCSSKSGLISDRIMSVLKQLDLFVRGETYYFFEDPFLCLSRVIRDCGLPDLFDWFQFGGAVGISPGHYPRIRLCFKGRMYTSFYLLVKDQALDIVNQILTCSQNDIRPINLLMDLESSVEY